LKPKSGSLIQGESRLSRNPKVHYRAYKSPILNIVLNYINTVLNLPLYFLHVKISYAFLICPTHTTSCAHLIVNHIIIKIMEVLIMQSFQPFCHFIPLRSNYCPHHSSSSRTRARIHASARTHAHARTHTHTHTHTYIHTFTKKMHT
jgi:hypothetical protein